MSEIESQSAHLVVTSPPYWNLKEYRANDDQLGHINDYSTFHQELNKVWSECFRILTPGGRLCIVVGDVCQSRKKHGRHQVVPLHADILANGRTIGFETLASIIWYKIANAVTEVAGTSGTFLGKPYEPNAIIKNDIEHILLLRKPGYRSPSPLQRDLSIIDPSDHGVWFRQIWDDVKGASCRDHPAPFPLEIADRLIQMFSFVGDTVVDPFLGTGTTTIAAMRKHRSSVGFEVDPYYFASVERRLTENGLDPALYRSRFEFFRRGSVVEPASRASAKR